MSDKNTNSVNGALFSLASRSVKRFIIGIGIEFIGIVVLGAIRSHSNGLMNTISQGLFGLSPWDAIGAVLIIILITAYVELYPEWGSRSIEWKIDKKMAHNVALRSHFVHGSITNEDVEIKEAHVQIRDIHDASGKIALSNMDLQLRGGLDSHTTLHSGGDLAFDVFQIAEDYPNSVRITGMLNRAKHQPTLPVGSYTFTLRLSGLGFRWNDHRIRVVVSANGISSLEEDNNRA